MEEDALYSSKSQFVEARFWSRIHYFTGIPTAILAAVAGGSAFTSRETLAGVLAAIVAGLTAAITLLNPSAKANQHHQAGTRYLALRNGARFFRTIDLDGDSSVEDLSAALRQLTTTRDKLNEESPQVRQRSFVAARAAIESGEADYAVDAPRRLIT